ncbi:hypothetical protein Tco_0437400, partial [Tanacetum coccineum]
VRIEAGLVYVGPWRMAVGLDLEQYGVDQMYRLKGISRSGFGYGGAIGKHGFIKSNMT